MKKSILFTITFLFSMALCYETINYCYQKMTNHSYCEQHLDCEESKSESEKNEKTEKEGMFDAFFLDKNHSLLITNIEQHLFKMHSQFSTNDYSKVVYSPPKLLLL